MRKLRIIPRLDIKGHNLIKGVHLEGLRILGDPSAFSRRYYEEGADELLYIDSVASLYERNNILGVVEKVANEVFVPLTVGGGIRSVEDARAALRSGADKIAINTAAVRNPNLIKQVAETFGNQCVVASIEAKCVSSAKWEAYIDNGREKTGLDVMEWAQQLERLGAGEVLITSVDNEGTQKGFDISLIKEISEAVSIPIIASGGMGSLHHLVELVQKTEVDAVAIAHVLHCDKNSLENIYTVLNDLGIETRR